MPGNEIFVRIMADDTDPSIEPWVRVEIRSRTRPSHLKKVDIPVSKGNLEYRVEVAGGAIAEALCEEYGADEAEPQTCARIALELFRDARSKLARDL